MFPHTATPIALAHPLRRGFPLMFSLIFLLLSAGSAQSAPPQAALAGPGLIIENVGQFPANVRFVVWGAQIPLWLVDDGVYLVTEAGPAHVKPANGIVALQPAHPLATKISFFFGKSTENWRGDVPVWGEVRYVGTGGGLTVRADGQLFADGDVAVSGQSLAVDAANRLLGVSTARSGDAPVMGQGLGYATLLRGSLADEEGALAVDARGSAYVVGQTGSTDFPVTSGTVITGYQGGTQDTFVAKLAPDGQSLLYATFLGGLDSDLGKQVAVDGAGNAYVVGDTSSMDYPTTPGAFFPTHSGTNIDAFITGLNGDGSHLRFSTFLGGSNYENASAIALAPNGDLVVAGRTQSVDFFVTQGAYDPDFHGGWDGFVTRMAGDGSEVRFSTFLGGEGDDGVSALAVDGDGNVYVGGYTWSSAFPTTAGAFDITFNGGYTDAFVAKFSVDGAALAYSTLLGGSAGEAVADLVVDATGHVFATGFTASPNFPTTSGAHATTPQGGDDVFVAKLLADGSDLAFSTWLGGSLSDYGRGIALDSRGDVVVMGETASANLFTTPGAVGNHLNGQQDLFVTKLSADGSALHYGTYLGGSKQEMGRGLAVDSADQVYVSGHTDSTDFVTADFATALIGPALPADATAADILVVKLDTPTTAVLRTYLPTLTR